MQESIVSQGLGLMVFGMGAVFIFLTILVLVTICMSSIMARFFPEALEPLAPANVPVPSLSPAVDAKTLKVIQAAIDRHRAR